MYYDMTLNSRVLPRPVFIAGIGKLVQPIRDFLSPEPLKIIENVWIEIADGKIKKIGEEGELRPACAHSDVVFDAHGMLATPGLIDSHTHPVFAGTREAEFIRRCRGETYQQIAAAGGGIVSSIRGVRAADEEELTRLVRKRFDRFIELGVTAIEAKSGYGLSLRDELKSLRVIREAAVDHPLEVSPTLLAAHVIPPEFKADPGKYVDLVCREIIPATKEAGLAESVDLFLEEGAFNLDQARRIFQSGKEAGFGLRIHADQFTSQGGAQLAAEFNALSADHMDQTDEDGIRALAEAGVVVVLLPGAVFFLGHEKFGDARRMIDVGCKIALSTDFNPGTSPTQSIPLMMTLGCIKMAMSPDEALWSVTMGAAHALKRDDRIGSLREGYRADICLWDAENAALLAYNYGSMIPEAVFKNGSLVALRGQRYHPE